MRSSSSTASEFRQRRPTNDDEQFRGNFPAATARITPQSARFRALEQDAVHRFAHRFAERCFAPLPEQTLAYTRLRFPGIFALISRLLLRDEPATFIPGDSNATL